MRHLAHIMTRPRLRRLWCALVWCVCVLGVTPDASAMTWGMGQICTLELQSQQAAYSPWQTMTPQKLTAAQLAMWLATYEQLDDEPCEADADEALAGATCSAQDLPNLWGAPAPSDPDVLDSGDAPDTLRASIIFDLDDLPTHDEPASCSGSSADPAQCQSAPVTPRVELAAGPAPTLGALALTFTPRRTRFTLPLVRAPSLPQPALTAGFARTPEHPPRA